MCPYFARRSWIFLYGIAMIAMPQSGPAHAFTCSEVNLMSASGVIGPVHSYTFSAKCEWSATKKTQTVGITGVESTTKHSSITMDVLGQGKWDRKSGEATEKLKVTGYGAGQVETGPFSGVRYAKGVCNEDPFLKDPPGGKSVCNGMNVIYEGNSGPVYDKHVDPKVFLLSKKVSLQAAQALSSKKASGGAPPPPPPKSQPKKEPLQIGDAQGAQGGMKASPGHVAAVATPESRQPPGAPGNAPRPGGAAPSRSPTWNPPAVKHVTTIPGKGVVVGAAVSIQCVVGSERELRMDTVSAERRYLAQERRPSWTLPVQVRVNGRKIAEFVGAGMSSPSATAKHVATWKPSAGDAGKPAVIECVVDPDKKLFFSSKTVSVPILLAPVPVLPHSDAPGRSPAGGR
jgi:hypothetical protein